jgi:hypothetical protein
MNLFDALPNFLIIGAAKSGTTTLYDLLKQHPQVYLSFVKETMFFSCDENFQRGPEWYARTYYKEASGFRARGDVTPHYLYWSEKVAPRVRETYGQVPIKFIAIFRDPVGRAYSWYWNMVKEGRENLPLKTALELEGQRLQEQKMKLMQAGAMTYGYIRGSSYASALEPFLEYFPRSNFLFLLQEDIDRNFSNFVREMLEFLGLDANILLEHVSSNPATMPRSRSLQRWLQNQSPCRELLKRLIPLRLRQRFKASLLQVNARPFDYPKIDLSIETELRNHLAPEVRRLEKMINRDLSAWLPG